MAVVKKSSSGNQIQFILSEDAPAGTVFGLSASLFGRVMSGGINGGFVLLSRLPIPVPASKYPPSVIWGAEDKVNLQRAIDVAGVKDVSSGEFLKVRKEQKVASEMKDVKGDW
jgi:hypothetical protein